MRKMPAEDKGADWCGYRLYAVIPAKMHKERYAAFVRQGEKYTLETDRVDGSMPETRW